MIKINFKARGFMWYKIIFNCKSKDGAKTLIPSWDYRFDFCGHISGKTLCLLQLCVGGYSQMVRRLYIHLRGILVLICDECKLMVYITPSGPCTQPTEASSAIYCRYWIGNHLVAIYLE